MSNFEVCSGTFREEAGLKSGTTIYDMHYAIYAMRNTGMQMDNLIW